MFISSQFILLRGPVSRLLEWDEVRNVTATLVFFQLDFLLFRRNTYSLVEKAIPFIVTGNYLFADTQVSDRTLYTLFFGTLPALSGNI